jgi:hypothetical protein
MALASRFIMALCGRVAAVAAGCVLGTAEVAIAQDNYVIELFTSQGCSFCPRADRWLAAIARNPGVVAISLPVDYWDYIGWRDTLASPAFTARQKAYAAVNGDRRVYTPEVIVNGLVAAAGGDEAEIEQAITQAKGLDGAMTVPIRLSKVDGHYLVEIASGSNGPASVMALRVARATTVEIRRGENAGKSLTYTNVVQAINKLGDWTGATETFTLPGTPQGDEGFVVLLQKGTPERPGAILAAVKSDGL